MSQATQAKKLVSVLAIFASMTGTNKKAQKTNLDKVPYIFYLVQLQKDKEATIWALIDLCKKIKTITLAYAK